MIYINIPLLLSTFPLLAAWFSVAVGVSEPMIDLAVTQLNRIYFDVRWLLAMNVFSGFGFER